MKRSASKNSLSYPAANGQSAANSPPATPTQPTPSTPAALSPAALPYPAPSADPTPSLTKSGAARRLQRPPSTSTPGGGGLPSTLVIPSAALDAQRRADKQRRAMELSRRQAADTLRLLEDEAGGGWDEEEQKRFTSLSNLKRDSELGEDVSAWVSKYRNAHHLNYSDYVKDGWFDDGGLIPGVNAARVGRERGGGRWEGDVVVYDAAADVALADLIEYAKRLVRQQDSVKGRVQILAQLVSNKLGGLPNDIVQAWERVMKRAHRYRQQRLEAMTPAERAAVDNRLILPAGALIGEIGLTRHRACLFKYLCDLTVQNPEEWCTPTRSWEVDDLASPAVLDDEKEREGGGGNGGGKAGGEGGEGGSSAVQVPRIGRFLDDSGVPVSRAEDDEKLTGSDDGRPNRLNQSRPRRASTDSDTDPSKDAPQTRRQHSLSPDELAIHCRLIRGQYQYYVPRSRKYKKDASLVNSGGLSPTNAPSPGGSLGPEGEEDEAAKRVGGYHAWNVVIIDGQHFVVDLICHPSQLYNESSREAMHYNRGRRGSPKQTGLTNLPIRDVREIEWAELTNIQTMKEGGFGRVERARWRGIDVVIKTPLTSDQYVLRTFHEEARLLNSLSHPNIVQLIGVCSDKKAIILEYINGGDVHQWIKSRKHTTSITLKERLDVLIQTALAMQYLHGCEPPIVHRDLKTLNLLIQNVGDRRVFKGKRLSAPALASSSAHCIFYPSLFVYSILSHCSPLSSTCFLCASLCLLSV